MRIFSKFLLAFCVMLGIMAFPVFADTDEDTEVVEEADITEDTDTDEDADAAVDYSDYYSQYLSETQSEEDELKSYAENYMETFAALDLDAVEYYEYNNVGTIQDALESYKTYLENDTLGDYVGIIDTTVEANGKAYDVLVEAEYEKVNLEMTMTFKSIGGQMTPVEFAFSVKDKTEKSLGEKMKGAALNTVIGLVTVFMILIIIAFLISRFVYISKLEEKLKERAEAKKEEKESPALDGISNVTAQIEAKEAAELVDDTELVAVITAAICAATGASSSGFVVRSIRKSKRR